MKSYYRILLCVIAGLLALGQLQRIELFNGRALYLHDIALLLWCGTWSVQYGRHYVSRFFSSVLGRTVFLLTLWILATGIVWFHADVTYFFTMLLYLLRFDTIVLFGFSLATLCEKKILTPVQLKTGMIGILTTIAVLGFFQYFFFPDTRNLKLLGWDDHYFRLISTIFDPGFTGILLAIGTLLLGKDLFATIKKQVDVRTAFSPKLQLLLFGLLFLALLLTYSRASFLAFGTGLGLLFVMYKKKAYPLLLGITAVGIMLLPRPASEGTRLERTASAVSRIESVKRALQPLRPIQFIIGTGWYSYKKGNTENDVHGVVVPNHASAPENSYIFVLTSLGMIGSLLWLQFFWAIVRMSNYSVDTVLTLAVVGVHAVFTNTFFHPFVFIAVVTIMGYSVPSAQSSTQSVRR